MYSKNYICLQIHCAYSGIPDDYMFFTQMFFSFFLQSALQPLWVLACSTIVEYSQQEGFYRVPLPVARQTPTWRTSDLERSTLRHTRCLQRLKRRKRAPVAEGGTMGEKLRRILPKVATSTSLLGSFTCRKFTTWDRRLSLCRKARWGFFRPKIPTASAGFEPASLGTKGQHAHL